MNARYAATSRAINSGPKKTYRGQSFQSGVVDRGVPGEGAGLEQHVGIAESCFAGPHRGQPKLRVLL